MIEKKIHWNDLGFEVAGSATNGVKALELVEKLQPDVVLTDIKMPYMDGLELSRRLNREYPNIYIMLCTGFDEFEYAKEAVHLEIKEYMLKPVNATELSESLTNLKHTLDREREEKLKALDAAIAKLEKEYGKGAVMKLGDPASQMNVETIPTGSLSLDIALGLGGIPKGRVIEIYGPESSGKTTVTLHMIAEVQKNGGIAGFIDAEHALDPVYAKNIGVDIDNLYISQPDNGEQALEITETMVRSGAVDLSLIHI